jgi:hypothetical protein
MYLNPLPSANGYCPRFGGPCSATLRLADQLARAIGAASVVGPGFQMTGASAARPR